MKKWLFNPFIYIAGLPALITGFAIMLATAAIAYYSHAHFDGVIDMHAGRIAPLQVYFWEQLIDWGCATILFYIAGVIFSKSNIRFIDVAGTFALARWPMIICAVVGFAIKTTNNTDDIVKQMNAMIGAVTSALLFVLPLSIWMIALMYNAFKVSCNIKGGKAVAIFIATLIVAEVFAHLILYPLYKHLM